jgi:hypothetical protein
MPDAREVLFEEVCYGRILLALLSRRSPFLVDRLAGKGLAQNKLTATGERPIIRHSFQRP